MPDAIPKPLSIIILTLVSLTAAVVVARIIPDGQGVPLQLSPSPQLHSCVKTVYYALPCLLSCICLITCIIHRKQCDITAKRISILTASLWCLAAVSLLVNPVAEIFQSWPRLFSVAIVILLAGPILFSPLFTTVRRLLLRFICIGCVAAAMLYAIALLCYLTRYTSYLSRYRFVWDWLNVASVPFGIASAIGTLFAWTRLHEKTTTLTRFLWTATMALCWWTMIMASSRAAIAGLTVAFTALLFLPSFKRNYAPPRWLRPLTIAMIAFMAVAVFRPLTEIMETKYWKVIDTPDDNFFSSREDIWAARTHESEHHLLIGIGYATVESNPGALNPDAAVPADGRVEPGSSWLYLLSSCGIFALTTFASIYLWGLTRAAKRVCSSAADRSPDALLILGLTLLFGIHLCTEGYVLAAGSPFCMMLWLTLGLAHTPPTTPARP